VTAAVTFRRAAAEDAERLARSVVEGVADYPAFAPEEWSAPSVEQQIDHLRALLAEDHVWCLIAEADGAFAGQVTILPAERAARPVDEPGLAHLSNLFVRRDLWGAGVASALPGLDLVEYRRAVGTPPLRRAEP
jgi:GNAT superfamily N-acetyltransferase